MHSFTVTILLFSLIINTQSFECPSNYEQIPREEKCFLAVNRPSFYARAARYCSSRGGLVAKVENVFENTFLQAFISADLDAASIYLGIEKDLDDSWTYSDGNPLTYKNWAPNEPNTSSNSSLCAIMSSENGLWYASECGFARPFYCSFDGDTLQCPPGWTYSNQTDHCYYVQNFTYPDSVHWQLYNFSTAEANCRRMNSHLASIHDKNEDLFVSGLVYSDVSSVPAYAAPNNNTCTFLWAWIGLTGDGAVGNGTWTDGSPVDYTGVNYVRSPPYTNWVMSNDPKCGCVLWSETQPVYAWPRYVCKMPARGHQVDLES